MISAILHVLVTKFIEIGRTPGVTAKLHAFFVGKHAASSIAGIVAAVAVVACAAIVEHFGFYKPDWQLVTGCAVALILGGRGARKRKKQPDNSRAQTRRCTPLPGEATLRSLCCKAPLKLDARGEWVCTACKRESSLNLPAPPEASANNGSAGAESGSASPTGGAGGDIMPNTEGK